MTDLSPRHRAASEAALEALVEAGGELPGVNLTAPYPSPWTAEERQQVTDDLAQLRAWAAEDGALTDAEFDVWNGASIEAYEDANSLSSWEVDHHERIEWMRELRGAP